jgi:hypothetical protein
MVFLKSAPLMRSFYRHVLSKLILKNRTFTDHSERMLVIEHELFKHMEIEIFVPARHVRSAAAFVQGIVQVFDGAEPTPEQANQLAAIGMLETLTEKRGSFTHHYPITFRRVLADDALISMTSGEDNWYTISFITYVEPRDAFCEFADFLACSMATLFDARLHWGKYFPLGREDVERSFPQLAEFRAICRKVDQHGVFRNAFVERVLFD